MTMCILFVAKNVHPDYPLIIAANRDEYFQRPTRPPMWWPEAPHIFAGKDLQAGGTWMGYNTQQQVAAITNVRRLDLQQDQAKSRGEWVPEFLSLPSCDSTSMLTDFTKRLKQESHLYNPFNLLYGNTERLMVFNSVSQHSTALEDGVHSISNGMLDDSWPKMQQGIEALHHYIAASELVRPNELFELLMNDQPAPDDKLPNTGVSLRYEKILSSIFIPPSTLNGALYGTRSSSVLLYKTGQTQSMEMLSQQYHGP